MSDKNSKTEWQAFTEPGCGKVWLALRPVCDGFRVETVMEMTPEEARQVSDALDQTSNVAEGEDADRNALTLREAIVLRDGIGLLIDRLEPDVDVAVGRTHEVVPYGEYVGRLHDLADKVEALAYRPKGEVEEENEELRSALAECVDVLVKLPNKLSRPVVKRSMTLLLPRSEREKTEVSTT